MTLRPWLVLSAVVVFPAPPVAAQNVEAAIVNVMPDRADWRYSLGDTARFRISLSRGGRPLNSEQVVVELGLERMPPFRTDTISLRSGTATISSTLHAPGFLRVTVTAFVEGTTSTSFTTAAFDPEMIEPTTPMPPDFRSFWRAAIAAARKAPLAAKMTHLPERSTRDVDVYHISFQSQPSSRLYGMLSMPTRPGKYPALLVVPGAGVRPYFPDVGLASRGVIHLRLGIHGIPVDRDSLLYNELRATALRDYWRYNLDDLNTYYYKRVYVGVVRAGDFLFSLPQFNGTHYVVQGGSQGGALAMVAGALDERVRGIAASHPALADHYGYLHGRASGWPHIFADTVGMRAKREKMETSQYYDVVNFARLLRVPGIYAWGFNDRTTPPTSIYAAYNVIRSAKQAVVAPEAAHFDTPAQSRAVREWVLRQLGITPGALQ